MQKEDILNFLAKVKPNLQKIGVDKLGLFGSYAKDSANEFSDIDIAFKLKDDFLQTHDVWKYFELTHQINQMVSKEFNKPSELFDLDSASSLRDSISKEVIYV